MNTSRIAVCFFSVALTLAASSACSSGSKGADPAQEKSPTDATPDASVPPPPDAAKPTTPKKDAAPADPPAGECASEATQTSCITCCSNKHADGSGTYFVALIDCMCLPDNCARDCEKTLCNATSPQNADTACQACVQSKNAKCATPIKSACQADPDCLAFDACIGASDCASK